MNCTKHYKKVRQEVKLLVSNSTCSRIVGRQMTKYELNKETTAGNSSRITRVSRSLTQRGHQCGPFSLGVFATAGAGTRQVQTLHPAVYLGDSRGQNNALLQKALSREAQLCSPRVGEKVQGTRRTPGSLNHCLFFSCSSPTPCWYSSKRSSSSCRLWTAPLGKMLLPTFPVARIISSSLCAQGAERDCYRSVDNSILPTFALNT